MLKINPSKRAEKFLRSIHPKHAKQIARKLFELRNNPFPQDHKKLSNSSFLRADVSEYRIIYIVNRAESSLEVVLIGKRNDGEVYRDLKNII